MKDVNNVNVMLGNYVICSYGRDSIVVGRVIEIYEKYFTFMIQGANGKENMYSRRKITYGVPFHEKVLEIDGWKYDSDANCWVDSTSRITIYKNPDGSSKKYRVHLDNEDMDSIGSTDFDYFHELQSYCRISGIEINFRFGTMRYVFNEIIKPQMGTLESENSEN